MIRKSIGLALLAAALTALVLTQVGGPASAAFDPFNQLPYYPYALPATGLGELGNSDAGGIPIWLVWALAGLGVAAIGFLALRLRSFRR